MHSIGCDALTKWLNEGTDAAAQVEQLRAELAGANDALAAQAERGALKTANAALTAALEEKRYHQINLLAEMAARKVAALTAELANEREVTRSVAERSLTLAREAVEADERVAALTGRLEEAERLAVLALPMVTFWMPAVAKANLDADDLRANAATWSRLYRASLAPREGGK